MKTVYRIDVNNLYVEDVLLRDEEATPLDCVDAPLPEGIFLPAKFANGQWETTLTQSEIDALLHPVVPLSEIEELKKQQTDLIFQLMLGGVI